MANFSQAKAGWNRPTAVISDLEFGQKDIIKVSPLSGVAVLRPMALCLLPWTLGSCYSDEAARPSIPVGCRMITAADLPRLQIYLTSRDMAEAVDRQRSAVTGEPASGVDDPAYDGSIAGIRLSQDQRRGHLECLAVGWKVVPVGPNPASGADFEGGQLPSGIAIVPKDGPDSYEVYIKARAIDDHATEPNEHFRVELTDASGATIWGRAGPDDDEHGILRDKNPKAAVFTIHDTERDCARPGAGSGYTLSVRERGGTYRLVIEQPEKLRQCAYVAWRYLDDTLPDQHSDAHFLQGMAYFSAYEDAAALGGYQQWFDLGIPFDKANAGRRVRVVWGLSSDRPAVATLTLPDKRDD
ncbi:MAG TPA: hypothetical protein VEB39_01895 [Sphingomicrobium sp.]|nr:hypothetical protein [Sphingomicrobium sp.]